MNTFFIFLVLSLGILAIPAVYAETFNQSMEGGMDLEITYPESVMKQRTFSISILLQNNGWENKQDISFALNNPDAAFVTEGNETILIDELTTTSSFGTTIDYEVTSNANEGIHFLNIDYTQVLVSNNTEPMPSTQTNIALPILVFGEPVISINIFGRKSNGTDCVSVFSSSRSSVYDTSTFTGIVYSIVTFFIGVIISAVTE